MATLDQKARALEKSVEKQRKILENNEFKDQNVKYIIDQKKCRFFSPSHLNSSSNSLVKLDQRMENAKKVFQNSHFRTWMISRRNRGKSV